MYTSIPQPASTIKRTSGMGPRPSLAPPASSRMSMAPRHGLQRSSSGGNMADLGLSTVKRDSAHKFSASSRKSVAPGSSQQSAASARRSSVYMRPSMGGFSHANSFFATTQTSINQRDPRALKDPAFRAKMAQEVMDYLLQNGFEMDMKYQLNPNALRSPTQKDFVAIFQWLYHRLDPAYTFVKVENDVLQLLKNLRYPWANSITKSQLTAVGSQNAWPIFLGMLHWIMELAQIADQCESGEFDHRAEAEGVDVGADKIMFRYITKCYQAWLAEDDDHEEYEQEMAAAFEERYSGYGDDLEMMEAENKRLKKELADLDDGNDPLKKLSEAKALLQEDTSKFVEYIKAVEKKHARTVEINDRLKAEIETAMKDLEEEERRRNTLQGQVDEQGLTPADIDRMNTEREKLNRSLSQISTKLIEAQNKQAERETEAQNKLDGLERAVSRYNTLAYKIGITPSSAPNAHGEEFEITIAPLEDSKDANESGKLLLDSQTGYQPTQLLNRDLRNHVKPALTKIRGEIGQRIHAAQDEAIRHQEYIERVMEALTDKKDEIETLDAKVQAVSNEYQELKETMQEEVNKSNAELEKQQANLQGMRVSTQRGVLETDQRLQSINMEYDQLFHAQTALREKLHAETKRIVEDVVEFKVHIQRNLGEYEERAEKELQEHLAGGDASAA
ncbi:HEC/Ndc80p family-domain-containing protein [Geopyxis carbonaria]|nr:HEC/Ndc80p family-domain-containing protein [Geopyxis carbonaria]